MTQFVGPQSQVRDPVTAFVALGANLGDPKLNVRAALTALGHITGVRLVHQSSLYRTAPVDSSGPDYVNAVAELSTTLSAPALLQALQTVENNAGRERPFVNAPRTLDLDLLLFGSARITSPTLTLPHPRMAERAFVLVPLAEIAPALVSSAQRQAVGNQAIEILA